MSWRGIPRVAYPDPAGFWWDPDPSILEGSGSGNFLLDLDPKASISVESGSEFFGGIRIREFSVGSGLESKYFRRIWILSFLV